MKQDESKKRIATAIASVLAAGMVCTAAMADDQQMPMEKAKPEASKEKCYGIAMAGKNDCSSSKHACASLATTDKNPMDFNYVPSGTCLKLGGTLKPDGKR